MTAAVETTEIRLASPPSKLCAACKSLTFNYYFRNPFTKRASRLPYCAECYERGIVATERSTTAVEAELRVVQQQLGDDVNLIIEA